MGRIVTVAAAQLGPIQRADSRADVVERLIALLQDGARRGAGLVVFPELALTTFFPRWWFPDGDPDLDAFYEADVASGAAKPLFDEARCAWAWASCSGSPSAPATATGSTPRCCWTRPGAEVGRYRKIHLPGHREHEPWRRFQHLEKRYFERGDLGFPVYEAFGGRVGMLICNDRRWPEAYRMLGLQGVELVCIGYNTPVHNPPAPEHDRYGDFHNHLVMQAGAYQNGTFVVASAKAGLEEGVDHIGGSCVIHPSGTLIAQCTGVGDEVAVAACDLDDTVSYKTTVFDFAKHRQPDTYGALTELR